MSEPAHRPWDEIMDDIDRVAAGLSQGEDWGDWYESLVREMHDHPDHDKHI